MLLSPALVTAVIFDVDGTLIDSNAAHADTWAQALTQRGFPRDAAQIRPLVGMGSDKLLPMVGINEHSPEGRDITRRKQHLFAERLHTLQPTRCARELVTFLNDQHKTIVIATSAPDDEMQAILRQAGVDDLIPTRASSDDAARSKPDPDIVLAALHRGGAPPDRTLMVGDTPYDVEAARRVGVRAVALRCGGYWSDRDLASAMAIFDDPADLLAYWRRA